MARKKIREFDAKNLIHEQLNLPYKAVLISENNLEDLNQMWLKETKLVVKPDQLFGKRKKHGLVLLNVSIEQVKQFIQQHLNKEVTIGKATDKLTHFLIEPFIPHDKEYYVSITSHRDHDLINFSEEGGINIEDNWDKVTQIKVPTLENANLNLPEKVKPFIENLFEIYREKHFCYLEVNPFTFNENNVILLDLVSQIDSRAVNMQFPKPFGKNICKEEEFIQKIDQNSGASLKLTILNPQGRIWNILSGGGASVIYLDTMVNQGENDIANYGEYGGNPTTQETYQYAKTVLKLMIKSDAENKILFIGGAIANFTDIEKTFKGVIQALEEYKDALQNIPIYVRRGGPNHEKGLQLIKDAGNNLGITIQVHGPDTPMVEMISRALE